MQNKRRSCQGSVPGAEVPDTPSKVPTRETLKGFNPSKGIREMGKNLIACSTAWSWNPYTACIIHWRESWNIVFRPTTSISRSSRAVAWASTSRQRVSQPFSPFWGHLSNINNNLLTPLLLCLQSSLQLRYRGSQSRGRVAGLYILLQRVSKIVLPPHFSELFLKRQALLLYRFSLHLLSMPLLGRVSSNQDIPLTDYSQSE